ncbi:MAG: hypothetical protein HYW71_03420 [Candidatus Niyogibacteria bacterium]|nr:hypothetical protein [Candidatus Niyogibacteria bacterium]
MFENFFKEVRGKFDFKKEKTEEKEMPSSFTMTPAEEKKLREEEGEGAIKFEKERLKKASDKLYQAYLKSKEQERKDN